MSAEGATPQQGGRRPVAAHPGPARAAGPGGGHGMRDAAAARAGARQGPAAGQAPVIPQLALTTACGGYAVGAAAGWGSERVAMFMGDFGLSAAGLLAAASCLWYARSRSTAPLRTAWALFGLSSLVAAGGNAIWGWYEVVLQVPVPQPSAADCSFLLFAPLAIVGLLVLAKRPVTRAGWVCLCLDSWLIGGSLLTLSWSLALARTDYWQGESVARAALTLAYPLLDIALVSMVLALHFKRSAVHRSAVNTVIGALTLTVLCDALFTSPLLREHYSSGQFLDAGWFAGSLLLAYAPWAARGEAQLAPEEARPPSRREDRMGVPPMRSYGGGRATGLGPGSRPSLPRGSSPWSRRGNSQAGPRIAGSLAALTPYLAAAVCTLGILYNALDGREIDRVVLFTAGTVVLALVVRQGIMLLDNINLTQELAQKENHFRSLVQGSSDVIMITSATGVLRYVSPAAAGVYGRDGDALEGSELAGLIHPEDLSRVLHELRRFLAAPPEEEPSTRIECRFKHGDGHWLNVESTVNRYQAGLIFNSRDVTERVRLQAQLQHNASHDPLTDLPNRALFTERVRRALVGRRGGDSEHAVLYIDLDGFKAVNDTVGHQAGDELLVAAAHRLQDSVRAGDTAARLGGDEFAVLILGDGNPYTHSEAERELRILEIADRLRLTLSEPYHVEGTNVRVAASIGIAFAEPGISPAALMRNADLAMYRAKQAGKARVELHVPQSPQPRAQQHPPVEPVEQVEPVAVAEAAGAAEAAERAAVGAPAGPSSLTRARGGEGELALLHQPVVELASGKISAVAAQPRRRSAQGLLTREARGGRTAADGRRLLEEAVAQAAARHMAGFPAPVTVRVPARRLTDRAFSHSSLEGLLERYELPKGSLVLELTGTGAGGGLSELELRLTALRRLGVCIALHGYGSGPPLTALRRLPVDILHLDRGLVDGVVESARQRKITAGLLRIAGDLGLSTVASGVDVPEQAVTLRELGCTHGLGAVFAGPLDEHRLRHALARGAFPVPEPAAGPRPGGAPRADGGRGLADVADLIGGGGERRGGPGAGEAPRPGAPPDDVWGRSVVVTGSLPVRHQERREVLPPWLVTGDTREPGDARECRDDADRPEQVPRPRTPGPHAETPVPPT